MSKPILIYEGGGNNPHIIGIIDTGKYADHDSKAMSAIINRRVNKNHLRRTNVRGTYK